MDFLNVVFFIYDGFLSVWHALVLVLTVWTDPMGRAGKPVSILTRHGRVNVFLLAVDSTTRDLRFLAMFWRIRRASPLLRALTPRGALVVRGVVLFAGAHPLGFRLRVDLSAETGGLTHPRIDSGGFCHHSLRKGDCHTLIDALAPLLGKKQCPTIWSADQ